MRKILLLIAVLIALCGCQEAADPAYTEFRQEHLFVSDLSKEDLPLPDETVHNLDDMIYLLDYLSFYRISDDVYVKIDPAYAETFRNPYTEFQKAYTQSDLADVYACNMDDTWYTQYQVISVRFSISREIASEIPQNIPETYIVPSFDNQTGLGNMESFYIDTADLKQISCENSEQLYYLVMNGYKPLCAAGSSAETIYAQAHDVLKSVIQKGQSEFEQIKAVYDWLTSEVLYDYETAGSSETYLVTKQAYYLEGVFQNHYAVCDGKAKAYALLLNMLGIGCYRQTGVNLKADHAWNMVRYDGKWYNSCTTYGQHRCSGISDTAIPDYAALLMSEQTPYTDDWGYQPQKHLDIAEQIAQECPDVYEIMSGYDEVSLTVADIDTCLRTLEQISSMRSGSYKAELEYTGTDPDFEKELTEKLNKDNIYIIKTVSERNAVYQVIYLNRQ